MKLEKITHYLTTKNIFIALATILVTYLFFAGDNPDRYTEEETPVVIKEKTTSVIVFGEWQPEKSRKVLATITSAGDKNIVAETSGTIAKTFVKIGDTVKENQILAIFQKTDNTGHIAYTNALNNLETTKLSTKNSVKSAEIALDTAQREFKQTIVSENQKHKKNLDSLLTETRNAETVIANTIDWADRILGASSKFKYQMDSTRRHIGSNSSIQKQEVKNLVEKLVREKEALEIFHLFKAQEEDYISFAQIRLDILKELQVVVTTLDNLIRTTSISQSFTETNRATFQTESEAFSVKIDGKILSLETKIESVKTELNRIELSLLTQENRIKSTESSLDLAKSTANVQVLTAQNQVNSTWANQDNLEIRAPFDGIISDKNISAFSQINMGQKLFSIISQDIVPKVVGFVTKEELDRLLSTNNVQIELSDNNIYEFKKSYLSFKIDPQTQKIKVEFEFEEFPEDVLIGSFAEIFVPLKNGHNNLLPISSLSFEPDGVEVLVLDDDNIARRQKIEYSKIISDSVEVFNGLENGTRIIEFRKRVHAGERIKIQTKAQEQELKIKN